MRLLLRDFDKQEQPAADWSCVEWVMLKEEEEKEEEEEEEEEGSAGRGCEWGGSDPKILWISRSASPG